MSELKHCHDCAVAPGEAHIGGCDTARCLWTGIQRLQCDGGMAAEICKVLKEAGRPDLAKDLAYYLSLDDEDHDCGEDVWTGIWPGVLECQEYGFWSKFKPGHGGWIRCEKDDPEASEDLNRLVMTCDWDRELGKYVLRA